MADSFVIFGFHKHSKLRRIALCVRGDAMRRHDVIDNESNQLIRIYDAIVGGDAEQNDVERVRIRIGCVSFSVHHSYQMAEEPVSVLILQTIEHLQTHIPERTM